MATKKHLDILIIILIIVLIVSIAVTQFAPAPQVDTSAIEELLLTQKASIDSDNQRLDSIRVVEAAERDKLLTEDKNLKNRLLEREKQHDEELKNRQSLDFSGYESERYASEIAAAARFYRDSQR